MDALRSRRTTYHIAEPMLRFHQLIVAPHEARLVRRHGIGVDQLDRLRHLRTILPTAHAPDPPRLLLFSRNGFEPELRREAQAASDTELIDLHRLYDGD